jgi:large subunit ribosomal protein L29
MASSLTAHELDDMNAIDLEARLREAKEELFNLRFQAATGQLESHGRLRTVKKDIARIYTVVRERELGIRTTPSADDDAKTQKSQKAEKAEKAEKAQKTEKAKKEGADA